MRQLKLKNVGNKVSDEMIAKTEIEIGVKIPFLYKEFLKLNNGGDMPRNFYKSKFDIRDFFGINDTTSSIVNMFFAVSEAFENTLDWFPLGFDAGDWIYCICLKEEKYGQVYLMRTDEIEEDEAFDFICNSFEEFIDGLQSG